MDAQAVLHELQSQGLSLDAEGDMLRVTPKQAITDRTRTMIRQHKPGLLKLLTGKKPIDLDALAADIAREHGVTPEQCLALLDADDRRDIEAGDQGMAEAWRGFVGLAAAKGWMVPAIALIDPPGPYIRCADCQHRQPTAHPVLIRCGMGRRAPGAGSAWWSLDEHLCSDFRHMQT